MQKLIERLRRYNDPTIYGEYGELMQEAASMLETQAAKIQQMALEYTSDQGQWIDETSRLRDEIAKYKALCGQMGEALECLHKVNLNNYKHDPDDYENTKECATASNALAAWREMEGGCDETSIST